jgi:hypothetical protein
MPISAVVRGLARTQLPTGFPGPVNKASAQGRRADWGWLPGPAAQASCSHGISPEASPIDCQGQVCRRRGDGRPRLKADNYAASDTCAVVNSCSNQRLPGSTPV